MKGGKSGRKKAPSGGAGRAGNQRGKPKGANEKRPTNVPPAKGSRKKPEFGWSSSKGDE